MSDLLRVNHLSVSFGSSKVVKDSSFSIRRGELLALVGESGSGKSVTAHSVMRLLPDNAAVEGRIYFDDIDLTTLSEADLRRIRGKRIGMIFQEPMSALNPLHTIGRQITEMVQEHQNLSKSAVRLRVQELLRMVGMEAFSDRLDTYPHQLSGGQRQRVMIAMAMANSPDLLIADEPTTALDVTLQMQILSLLKELQAQHGMAILLITHDLTIVRRLSDRVAIMQRGDIVEQGKTADIFSNPQHDYTRMLLSSEPKGSALPLPADAAELLSCTDLKVHFPIKRGLMARTVGHVKAVDGVSLSLKAGETIGIVGESGSGKTTFGLALLRLIKSDGPVVYLGRNISELNTAAMRPLRHEMQLVFQDPYASLNPRMTVGEIIAEGLCVHHPELSPAERDEQVGALLEQVGLTREMMTRYPHAFSGGQRQRISIARAMILRPKLVVLDEPTSALDLSVQSQIIDLLKSFQQEGQLAYLFISHDLRVIRAISHRVMVLKGGQVVEQNATEALFSAPQNAYTKGLISAAFDIA